MKINKLYKTYVYATLPIIIATVIITFSTPTIAIVRRMGRGVAETHLKEKLNIIIRAITGILSK